MGVWGFFLEKKFFTMLLAGVFLLALTGSASAFLLEAPSGAFIFDSPRDFWIIVKNDSPIDKTLDVRFFSPATSDLLGVPDVIQANSESKFTLRIYPAKGLEGQTYESTLVVSLDNEKAVRTISLAFKNPAFQRPVPVPEQNQDSGIGFISAGFVSLAAIGSENALTIVLVIIAAILLIAFIARFLHRIN